MISERQELILNGVVEGHLELGVPVGSKWVAEHAEVICGPSTVRTELAALEKLGFLYHPHTSAGRVPTDSGYRNYADRLLKGETAPVKHGLGLDLTGLRRDIDEAMHEAAHVLSQVAELLAIVSAPSMRTATVRHVEVLLLRANVVEVVVITSSGAVSKRIFTFEKDVDQGLVEWAGSYFSESLKGIELGARMLATKLDDSTLGVSERQFLRKLEPAFTDFDNSEESTLYVEGASHLLGRGRLHGASEINDLLQFLEQRYSLLALLRSAIGERGPYLRIGGENPEPELKSLSVVAANYGLVQRNLGTVGLIGPVSMDYQAAIAWVQDAAATLSDMVEDMYQ